MPADAEEGHLNAPPIAALAATGLRSRPAAQSTGRAGDQGDLRRRWLDGLPPCHLQDEAPFATPQKATSVLLNCLNGHLKRELLPESQCGFRGHPATADMIFAARQLKVKYQEMRTYLYTTFVDLTKAFDTVNREIL
nr:unnamed protein product [Spirometra erinaceieuropaei]